MIKTNTISPATRNYLKAFPLRHRAFSTSYCTLSKIGKDVSLMQVAYTVSRDAMVIEKKNIIFLNTQLQLSS